MKRHLALSMLLLPMAILTLGCEKTPADEMRETLFEMAEVQEDGFNELLDIVVDCDDACALAVRKGRAVVEQTNSKTKALYDKYRNQVRKLETKERVAIFDAAKKRFGEAVENMRKRVTEDKEELSEFGKACLGSPLDKIGSMMGAMQSSLTQRMYTEW